MYLLMLLAAFISQMYGFNLSARPDYDRDVAIKKAQAVIYKFLFQDNEVKKLLVKVSSGSMDTYGLPYTVLPNDAVYAHFDAVNGACGSAQGVNYKNDTTLYYHASSDEHAAGANIPHAYFMRRTGLCQESEDKNGEHDLIDELSIGRQFFTSSRMISRVICVDADLQVSGAKDCELYSIDESTGERVWNMDPSGTYVKSCCSSGRRFLLSYMRVDPRWLNRVTQEVSFDLLKAVSLYDYAENIGVITWHNGETADEKYWLFRGKLHFRPAYIDEQNAWISTHPGMTYPVELTQKSVWKLPKYFTESYFQGLGGDTNFCKPACLIKIRAF